jgi:hypothetical protein
MQKPLDIKQSVLEKMRSLSVEKQQEVLDFVEFLTQKNQVKPQGLPLKGLWADLNVQVTLEDIAEVRQEMWGKFPEILF